MHDPPLHTLSITKIQPKLKFPSLNLFSFGIKMADVSNDRKVKLTKNGKVVKKRIRNPEEWHKQKQKRLRIAGLEYVSANGKVVPPKQPGPDCNCRRKCFERVPEDIRLKTFSGFYAMKSHDEQNAYLFGLMRQVDVKRKRVKNSSRRTCTFEYFVRVKGRETQICQTAFKNIHSITERKVRVLCKKMDDGVMFPSDNRGKNSHRRSGEVRLPNGVVEQIKNHIYSIVHTHRLKDFIRLDKIAGLEINVSKMWKDYITIYDPSNVSATMPKSKRNSITTMQSENIQPQHLEQLQEPQQHIAETNFALAPYAGNGHLVNIAENYFQNQYQTQTLTAATPITATTHTGYYHAQSGSILLQPTTTRTAQPTTAYIVLQPKQEPAQAITMAMVPLEQSSEALEISVKDEDRRMKNQKKKGPMVKQWRYTSIFQNEINGAALAAIKTRLAMYYAESDSARKKAKQPNKVDTAVQVVPQPQQQEIPTHTMFTCGKVTFV